MKKWLKITLGLLLVTSVISLLAFVSSQPKQINCYDVSIKIVGDPEAMFVSEEEILHKFQTFCTEETGDESTLNLKEIEENINSIPSVLRSDIYKNVNGTISIEVELKKVIGRIYNKSGDSYYLDSEGGMMPIVEDKPARVCIVNGEIFEGYSNNAYYLNDDSLAAKSIVDDIFRMLDFINKDEFWKAQIEQLYVTSDRKFILIPVAGMHEIMFGEANHIEGKFKKLELFYQSGINRVGWDKYSTIDIQYKGQIIGIGQEEAIIPVVADTSASAETLNNGQTEPQ
jgi:cell division protein FtsQ